MLKSYYSLRSTGCPRGWWLASHCARIFLMALVFGGVLALPALAQGPQATNPSAIESQVKQFGIGKDVKITLAGGEKLRGHIARIGANSFTVRLRKNKAERELLYSQVTLIKDPGPIFWILVGAAIVVIIIVAVH